MLRCRKQSPTPPNALLPASARAQADLERIRSLLLQQRGAIINATGDERALEAARTYGADQLLAALPATSAGPAGWKGALHRGNEALVVPTQVRHGLDSGTAGIASGVLNARSPATLLTPT